MLRLFGVVLVTAAALASQPPAGEIRGIVMDTANAPIEKAPVRARQEAPGSPVLQASSDADGSFTIPAVAPGTYLLHAWQAGFLPGILKITVRSGETTDVGKIALALAGCDAPGVMCDSLRAPSENVSESRVVVRTYVNIDRRCGVSLNRGESSCSHPDLALRDEENGTVQLVPGNGAEVSPSCARLRFGTAPLRIDGLGPGDDFCVRTRKGLSSHVFLVDEVPPGAAVLRLWCVTRK